MSKGNAFIRRTASLGRKHGKAATFGGFALGIATLFVDAYFEHRDKSESQRQVWQTIREQGERIARLEGAVHPQPPHR